MVDTSILIVSHNTKDLTLSCIRSVFSEAQNPNFEVIAIDNASNDDSADSIQREFPAVHLIRSSENLGFARANNQAAKRASGSLLLLLNPDTVVLDHAIDRLVTFAAAHPQAGLWGGRTVFENGELNPTSCWRFMSLWSIFTQATGLTAVWRNNDFCNREGYGGWHRDCVRDVDILTGCFLLVRRDLWDSLGGFDESFFMYAEEADLCFRARKAGAKPLFTPEASIIHYGGASETDFSGKIVKLYSGKITFLKKHWSPLRQTLAINLFKLGAFWRMVGYSALAAAIGTEKRRSMANKWRSVWSRRRDWQSGYH
jgi:GT2 family glycosyltransferase